MLGYGKCVIGNEPGCVELQLEKNNESPRCSGIAGSIEIAVLLFSKDPEKTKAPLYRTGFFVALETWFSHSLRRSRYWLTCVRYAFLRLATPINPSKPEPKSQAAAGIGTLLIGAPAPASVHTA